MHRHRGIARRLLAGMLALWFAVVATEGARLHACAMHGGSVASEGAPATVHAGHGAMHGGHDAAAADAGSPSNGDGAHQCTCPDTSCGSASAALASARVSTHFGIAVADLRAVFSPASGHRPAAVPYLTPFANGPPARALA
jgi:hypothetical protein